MTIDNKIIDKIRKLLALSKSSNQHEAELAMQKANELLEQHQLSMSDVDIKEMSNSKVYESDRIRTTETWRSFVPTLASASGLIFDCESIRTLGRESIFRFIGLQEDIVCAQILFEHLFQSWESIVKVDYSNWRKQCYYPPRQYDIKKYKISHGQGFSDAVYRRAHELAAARKKKVESTGTDLIVLKDQLIKQHMDKMNLKTGRGFTQHSEGYDEGHAAGMQVPLSGALTGEDEKEQLT